MRAVRPSPGVRIVGTIAALVAASALLTACRPEPVATPTATDATPSPTVSEPSPSPSPMPSPTETNPPAAFELPARCEDLYSAKMLASLNTANPPLNDPGVTMHSTQNADALEVLTSGIPTVRCSWGKPSEFGLSTNVSVVDAAQSAAIIAALRNAGFSCDDVWSGVRCSVEQKTVDQDDHEVAFGETHFLRGTGWVSTAWVNFAPAGYTEDVVATLWR
ncbi:hypothetical protein [Microbacterium deminutum]|uniref:DUF3558 domain-containing protein n=1 Tax=Microbacterium deminutum TaxID=344164 RepID=A0ABN2QBH5_9MICO